VNSYYLKTTLGSLKTHLYLQKEKRSTDLENLPLFFLNLLLLYTDVYIGMVGIGKELKTINRQL